MMCVSANGAVLAVGWMLVGRLGCMTGTGKKRVRKSPEERKAEIVAAAVKLIGEKGGSRVGDMLMIDASEDPEPDRKSTRLNSSHITRSRMPSSA